MPNKRFPNIDEQRSKQKTFHQDDRKCKAEEGSISQSGLCCGG